MPQDGPKIVPRALLAALGHSWTALGPLLAALGRSWLEPGASWVDLGASWGDLGPSWGEIGWSRGDFWGTSILEEFLERFWVDFQGVLGSNMLIFRWFLKVFVKIHVFDKDECPRAI